jgi:hypothetical protein
MGLGEALLLVVTLVLASGRADGKQAVTQATGFFYVHGETVYLVTNRHVVLDEKKKWRAEGLRLRLHTDRSDFKKSADFDIPLYVNGKPRWHQHPDYEKRPIDIAVVELDQQRITKDFFIKGISLSAFLPADFVIGAGEDVMIMGFPRGVADDLHNLPIIRNASVASAYGVDFRGMPFFLVDANLHKGMSGSPVMTKARNTWTDKKGNISLMPGTPMYFLGIHSSNVSVPLNTGEEEQLGLGTVWYAHLIEEIIASAQSSHPSTS